MKPLIHIGYPKTATTWFQRNYYPVISDIYVPHHKLIKQNIISPFDLNYKSEKYYQNITKGANGKRIVICEENLVGSLQNGGMQGFHTKETGLRLKALFPESDIIIFIRNQIEMVASAYIQYVKGGGNYSAGKYLFDRQFDYNNSRMLFSLDFFKYHQVIGFYKRLFGEEKVHVFLYEDFAENNKEFVRQFSQKFSFDIDIGKLDYSFQNIRLRRGLIPLARFTNSFSKRPVIYKYYLLHVPFWYLQNKKMILFLNKFRVFGKFPNAKEVLGEKTVIFLEEYFRESNQYLIRNHQLESIISHQYPH